MSLLSLIVKVGMDASGFSAGLKKVEHESDGFAGRFSAKFTKMFIGGMAVNFIRGMVRDTVEASKNIEETQARLAKYGAELSKSQVESIKLSTPFLEKLGATWESVKLGVGSVVNEGVASGLRGLSYMLSMVKGAMPWNQGSMTDYLAADVEDDINMMAKAMSGAAEESERGRAAFIEKRTKERAELQKKIDDDEEEAYKSKLTNEEKLLELVAARKLLEDAIASGQIPNKGKRMEAKRDIFQLTREINQLELGAAKKSSGKTSKAYGFDYSPPTDDLSRIGIFNRSSDYALTSIGNRIVSAVEMTAENTKTLAEGL